MAHPPHRNPPRARVVAPAPPPRGFAARLAAADLLDAVLRRGRPLDEQLEEARGSAAFAAMEERDRALVRRIVATVLRRLGTLRALLKRMLQKGLPADAHKAETALLIGAAQILYLKVPDHAAVDLSVRLVQADRRAERYTGLVNAILRRIVREGTATAPAEADDGLRDTPAWLLKRWTRTYGAEGARAIARANQNEPPLDVTVKEDAAGWAEKLEGRVLPTGSVRLLAHGPVTLLPGFAEGAWWVQDAAAALPVRLLGDVSGLKVADLCAAPGGKTAQLAFAGAHVTAVDRSEQRLARLRDNLKRLSLTAETVAADAAEWRGASLFDAVLLDAPCSSTGTIRRHPDIPWVKREADFGGLASLQRRLLTHAVSLLRPGGTIVYCTCSLEPEEGEEIVAAVLAAVPALRRVPITAAEVGHLPDAVTADGDLRTRPSFLPDPDPAYAGLDGFYAARLSLS